MYGGRTQGKYNDLETMGVFSVPSLSGRCVCFDVCSKSTKVAR